MTSKPKQMNDDQILDLPLDEQDSREHVQRNLASNGKRFANMIIDIIVVYALMFLIGFFWAAFLDFDDDFEDIIGLSIYLIYFFYYWIMESLTGKTVGKYVTRTKIVKPDGSKPDAMNVLGRSLSRYIPFDHFSFLGEPGKGWHDSIPNVYVINDVH